MRRQHGRDPEVVDLSGDLRFGRARAAEPVGRGTEGRVRRTAWAASLALVPAGSPHELALLGEVHETEVEAEGTDHDLGTGRFECCELGHETGSERRVVAAPEADRRPANPFDEIEQVPTGLLGDHLAEKRTQETDLQGERIAGAAGPDAGRLGPNRVVLWTRLLAP